jgi:hypothetical protein
MSCCMCDCFIQIAGTGDDNCHYQGVECLINELVRQNKQFRMFAYPNRYAQQIFNLHHSPVCCTIYII